MLSVIITDENTKKRLQDVLKANNGSAVRIREYTMGSACRARTILGLSLQRKGERPKSNDNETVASGIHFLAEQDIVEQYGNSFRIAADEKGELLVSACS